LRFSVCFAWGALKLSHAGPGHSSQDRADTWERREAVDASGASRPERCRPRVAAAGPGLLACTREARHRLKTSFPSAAVTVFPLLFVLCLAVALLPCCPAALLPCVTALRVVLHSLYVPCSAAPAPVPRRYLFPCSAALLISRPTLCFVAAMQLLAPAGMGVDARRSYVRSLNMQGM
jgi:hypothetical protein